MRKIKSLERKLTVIDARLEVLLSSGSNDEDLVDKKRAIQLELKKIKENKNE